MRRRARNRQRRTENHIDSPPPPTAIVTQINGSAGEVNRTVGGNALIEGSVVSGAVVNPLTADGSITAVAAVDTRHVKDSVFTSTIRWQGTDSNGNIQQTHAHARDPRRGSCGTERLPSHFSIRLRRAPSVH